MELADVIDYCLSLPDTESSTPFGPDVLVYKVRGKLFALAIMEKIPHRVNLKCDPERSLLLRDEYPAITAGYHMNKKHWNSVTIGGVPSKLMRELVKHSYDLVVASMPKPKKKAP
jgi:predicted DNA-binding protein (MmcQ/YjbR family)